MPRISADFRDVDYICSNFTQRLIAIWALAVRPQTVGAGSGYKLRAPRSLTLTEGRLGYSATTESHAAETEVTPPALQMPGTTRFNRHTKGYRRIQQGYTQQAVTPSVHVNNIWGERVVAHASDDMICVLSILLSSPEHLRPNSTAGLGP